MFSILIILLILDCIGLMVVVLLQAGKGGGLAAGFGGSGTGMEAMGSRQTATFLHSATKWMGGAFLVISFMISLITVRSSGPRSLIETEMQRESQDALPATDDPAGVPTDLQDMLQEGGESAPPAAEGEGQGAAEPEQP